MAVTLSPDVVAMIEAELAAGGYASPDEVMRAALLRLRSARHGDEDAIDEAWLKEAYEEGLAEADPRDDVPFDAAAILAAVKAAARVRG